MTENKESGVDSAPIKLLRRLTQAGVASRRNCFAMVMDGAVEVNGQVLREPSAMVGPDDVVMVGGKRADLPSGFTYVMLNKPRGYICALSDSWGGKLAIDLIDLPGTRLFNVGRLDKDSEGLLIFTDDGDYANRLAHPSHGALKTYEVNVGAPIPDKQLRRLLGGVVDDGETLRPERIVPRSGTKYLFVLNEGKKREIRRLVRQAGTEVRRLKRLALGRLELGGLAPGKWRQLSPEDLENSLTNPDLDAAPFAP